MFSGQVFFYFYPALNKQSIESSLNLSFGQKLSAVLNNPVCSFIMEKYTYIFVNFLEVWYTAEIKTKEKGGEEER